MKHFATLLAAFVLTTLTLTASAETYCNSRTGKCGAYSAVVKSPTDIGFLSVQKPVVSAAAANQAALAAQVAKQTTASGASCAGYWQSGRCVPNGLVAFNGGSPVNVMNQPKPVNAGGGKKQVCTLVYKYVGGRVVGNAQSVCTFQ